jgi:hypothetical protein
VTLEKSVLEQANSQYEVQGEYVLRGQRAGEKERDEEVMWERAMAGQLGTFITSMGRWRLRLDVPHAEVSEMLPVARLLSRSSDPAVVSRSKELFLQGVQTAGFSAENLKELLEYIRRSKEGSTSDEGSPESIPLPGLAELKGQWHGTLEATGGGKGDTAVSLSTCVTENFHLSLCFCSLSHYELIVGSCQSLSTFGLVCFYSLHHPYLCEFLFRTQCQNLWHGAGGL